MFPTQVRDILEKCIKDFNKFTSATNGNISDFLISPLAVSTTLHSTTLMVDTILSRASHICWEASVPSLKCHISQDGGRSEMLRMLTYALSLSHKHTPHTSHYHIPCCCILDILNAHDATSNLNG